MTLAAQSFPSAAPPATSRGEGAFSTPPNGAAAAAAARGFAELDERVVSGGPGVLLVRAPTRDAALAVGAHVARRVMAAGQSAVVGFPRDGAPLWSELAALLGVANLPCEPTPCADEIAQAATSRKAVLIAPLPVQGSPEIV